MASAMTCLYSEFDRLRIEADDSGTIWIRSSNDAECGATVALNLSRHDRDALRRALDQAAEINSTGAP